MISSILSWNRILLTYLIFSIFTWIEFEEKVLLSRLILHVEKIFIVINDIWGILNREFIIIY